MRYLFLWGFMVFAPRIVSAESISITSDIKIEPATSFATVELWNATTPTSVELGDVTVNYRMLDTEAPITRGKWIDCALVMVGTGDLAFRPVAFRIWTKKPCNLSIRSQKEKESSGGIKFDFFVNSKVSLPVQVSSALVVSVAGKRVGRIQVGIEK
jgi:hypothetical protein